MKKRILSLLLVVCMVMSMLSTTVLAEEATVQTVAGTAQRTEWPSTGENETDILPIDPDAIMVNDVVYVVGTYNVDTSTAYGDTITTHYAQGVNMEGKEVNFAVGVEDYLGSDEDIAPGFYVFREMSDATSLKYGLMEYEALDTDYDAKKANLYGQQTAVSAGFELTPETEQIAIVGGETALLTEETKYIAFAENTVVGPLDCRAFEAGVTCTLDEQAYVVLSRDEDGNAVVEAIFLPMDPDMVTPSVTYQITVDAAQNGSVSVDKTTAGLGETITVSDVPAEGYKLSAVLVDGEEIEGNRFVVTGEHRVSARFIPVNVVGIVYVVGTYDVSMRNDYGAKYTIHYAQGVDMEGKEVNLAVGVEDYLGSDEDIAPGFYVFREMSDAASLQYSLMEYEALDTDYDEGKNNHYGQQTAVSAGFELTPETEQIAVAGGKTALLTNETKYIAIAENTVVDVLEIAVFTGGVYYTFEDSKQASAVLSRDENGNTVVEALFLTGTWEDQGIVYIPDVESVSITSAGIECDAYRMNGEMFVLTVPQDSEIQVGFYRYHYDAEEELYKLAAIDSSAVKMGQKLTNIVNKMLITTDIPDGCDATNAVIVDARSEEEIEDSAYWIETLSDLKVAQHDEMEVFMDVLVDEADETVIILFVTAVEPEPTREAFTRRSLAVWLAERMFDSQMQPTESGAFIDIDKTDVNYREIMLCAEWGLLAGNSEGEFVPEGTVTRAQLAAVLVKALYGRMFNPDSYKGMDTFSDAASFEGGWAEGYINLITELGAMYGYDDGTFRPGNLAAEEDIVESVFDRELDNGTFASGYCGGAGDGTNLTWTLYKDGELVIAGTGVMANYDDSSDVPWYADCSSITDVTIGDGVTTISPGAFQRCLYLTNVTIPRTVTAIGGNAFMFCESLRTITVDADNENFCVVDGSLYTKDMTTLIRFASTEEKAAYMFPNTVTNVLWGAFHSCSNLGEITIPKDITYLGDWTDGAVPYVLYNTTALETITVEEGNSAYCVVDGVLFSPDKTQLLRYPSGDARTEYTVPDTVTTIGGGAFRRAKNLIKVTISDHVTVLGGEVFHSASGLKEVVIGRGVSEIPNNAFTDCNGLTRLEFLGDAPTSVAVDGYAMPWYADLTIYYHEGTTGWLESGYFDEDEGTWCGYQLEMIETEKPEREILASGYCGGEGDGTNLTWTLYKDGELVISGQGAMQDWWSYSSTPWYYDRNYIKSICIEDGVTTIGEQSFYRCTNLTEVSIPDSVTNIPNYAFYRCSALTEVTIPDDVTYIGFYAFSYCYDLSQVNFGSGLTSIYADAFYSCESLTELLFPADLDWIDYRAFYNCYALQSVKFLGDAPSFVGNSAFRYCSSNLTFYAYHDNTGWPTTGTWQGYTLVMRDRVPIASGHCGAEGDGTNLSWSLYEYGKLVIEGNGEMTDFAYDSGMCDPTLVTTITVGEGVTTIGDYAFFNFVNAKKVDLPSTLTYVGEGAFMECHALKQIELGDRVEGIGNYAFSGCDSLKSMVIPDSVTFIGEAAFSWCTSMSELTIGAGVETIGAYAFSNCWGLTKVAVPESVTQIGDRAFSDCVCLGSVIFRCDMPNVGSNLFSGSEWVQVCYEQYTANWPDADVWQDRPLIMVTAAGQEIIGVGSCGAAMTWTLCADGELIIEGSGEMTDFAYDSGMCDPTLVTTINVGEGVTTIGDYAFFNFVNTKKVDLPSTLTYVGEGAFMECHALKQIELGDRVEGIGNYAFSGCDSLKSMVIPDSVTFIGEAAFSWCTSMSELTIGSGVELIGAFAFNNGWALTKIVVPASVTQIGDRAFSDCMCLGRVEFMGDVPTVGNGLYSGSNWVQSFYHENTANWPGTGIWQGRDLVLITEAGQEIVARGNCGAALTWTLYNNGELVIEGSGEMTDFAYDSGLCDPARVKTVVVGEGVTTIGDYAFFNFVNAQRVILPESLTYIGEGAFMECHDLKVVELGDRVEGIGNYAFSGCDSLKSMVIPDSVTFIGEATFSWCTSMSELTIGSGVEMIGAFAFSNGWALTKIVVPASVTQIGDRAFSDCVCLGRVEFMGDMPTVGNGLYSGSNWVQSFYHENTVNWPGIGLWQERPLVMITTDGEEIAGSGSCGADLTWTLYNDGWLIIEGSGEMTDFAYDSGLCDPACVKFIEVREGVTTIGDYAFFNFVNAQRVILPESLTYIGEGAFMECHALKRMELGNQVVGIGNYAFSGCDGLKFVEIPDSVTFIGEAAFSWCTSMKKLTIGSGVETISAGVFSNCWSLGVVTIPATVTRVEENAFYGCSGMLRMDFLGDLPEISDRAFADCVRLTIYYREGSNGWPAQDSWKGHPLVKLPNQCKVQLMTMGSGTAAVDKTRGEPWEKVTITAKPAEGYALKRILVDGEPMDASSFLLSGNHTVVVEFVPLIASGKYGNYQNKMYWELLEDGELIISGSGEIPSYYYSGSWQRYSDQITEITVRSGVTGMGYNAFYNCRNVTKVTLPYTLTTIGQWAFEYCESLTEIVIPNGVRSIEYGAFYGCRNLTKVTLPDSLTTIGDMAFENCESLTEIVIPSGVTTLGSRVFAWCYNLTKVTLPDSLTAIGEYAFNNCRALTEITIPDSVTTIGNGAFQSCQKLTEITLPDGLTSIGEYAFAYCNMLAEVDFPNGLTSIGAHAFVNCNKLTKVAIPATVTEIGDGAFQGCNAVTAFTVDKANPTYCAVNGVLYTKDMTTLVQCPGKKSGAFVIPDQVTKVAAYAFANGSVTSVTIPAGVTEIGDQAFDWCNLTKFVVAKENPAYCAVDGVLYTKNMDTLVKCPGQKTGSFTVAPGVKYIADYAFSGCYRLTEVVIPEGVTEIGESAFQNCNRLTKVTLPNSVTTIGAYAFYSCSQLSSVTLPENLTTIEDYLFGWCEALTRVVVPAGVTELGDGVFQNCTALTEVAFHGNVPETIGWDLFWSCSDQLKIYCYEGGKGWLDSEHYDAAAGTWFGYPLVVQEDYDVQLSQTGSTAKLTVNAREAGLAVVAFYSTKGQMIKAHQFQFAAGENQFTFDWEQADRYRIFLLDLDGKPVGKAAVVQEEEEPYALTRGNLCMLLVDAMGLADADVSGQPNPFSDVSPEDEFYEAVLVCTELGILGGYGDGRFGPYDAITREQYAVLLWNMAGYPSSGKADLSAYNGEYSAWAENGLSWAIGNGVMWADNDGSLRATEAAYSDDADISLALELKPYALTRGNLCMIIVEELEKTTLYDVDEMENPFSDLSPTMECYRAVLICRAIGIIGGYGDDTFKPERSVTTAEAVTLVLNAAGIDAGEGPWPMTVMSKAEELGLFDVALQKPATNEPCYSNQIDFTFISRALNANSNVSRKTV